MTGRHAGTRPDRAARHVVLFVVVLPLLVALALIGVLSEAGAPVCDEAIVPPTSGIERAAQGRCSP